MAGVLAVLIGAAVVFFSFPKAERECQLVEEYHQKDMAVAGMNGQAGSKPAAAPGD
jgi:hypothetical protein